MELTSDISTNPANLNADGSLERERRPKTTPVEELTSQRGQCNKCLSLLTTIHIITVAM